MVSDKDVLLHFLKSSFSTHQMDSLMKHDRLKNKGWKSSEVINKYLLQTDDTGKLYLYTQQQCKEMIGKIIANPHLKYIDELITLTNPGSIEKYKDTYVLASSEQAFYDVFNGEARNIIQNFFKSRKKLIGVCQLRNCNEREKLETAHLEKDRKEIFIESAALSIVEKEAGLIKFDVYKTMRTYLLKHQDENSVRFLCKKHHTELDILKKQSDKKTLKIFKKLIINDMNEIEKRKLISSLVPAFPIGLKFSGLDSNSVVIEWKEEPVSDSYKLMKDGKVIYDKEFKNKGLKIDGLNSGQTYEFSLIACNKYGESPVSYLKILTKK
ncbi:fibronectin type III domain-containing protein [Bacillus nitratireducens]|uniref:Fibronectin type III domain-containing protein n=1 Tax=Bacillus nitratireducens TaxID=2026193 RepID=A0ABU6P663_9BACI|nr:fibronectin type III domain-containing protein [Bacillus nitratireducens]